MANKICNFFRNGFSAVKIKNFDDLKNMYYGNVPLVYVFWIFGFVILGLFSLAHGMLSYGIVNTSNQVLSNILLVSDYLLLCIYIPLSVLNFIAAWRSASKYNGRAVWRILTKIFLGVSCVVYVVALVCNFLFKDRIEAMHNALNNQDDVAWVGSAASDSEFVSS
ncbi:MAG: hypothetical protein KBD64_00980 [Gammaproteobacteria bacterium]|nr:hypothetical protein [Gammaproteobacteria bacterium]